MYDYIITKPELSEDTLEHYGIKGMKWGKRKAHLKGKALELKTKINRRLRGINKNQISDNHGKEGLWYDTKTRSTDSKAGPTGSTYNTDMGYSEAARKRAKKGMEPGAAIRGYSNYDFYNGKYYYKGIDRLKKKKK